MRTYTKFSILAVLFLSLININMASAQLRIGVKGGYDIISNRINKDILNTSNRLGFQIGASVELMSPVVGWGGELSVLYGHQKGDDNLTTTVDKTIYELTDYDYIKVPLDVKKKFDMGGLFGLFIQAGPYVEFKIDGADFKEKENVKEQWESKTFGAGVNAGAGIELMNRFQLGMYYDKALTNNYGKNAPSIGDLWEDKPDNWSVNLTYYF